MGFVARYGAAWKDDELPQMEQCREGSVNDTAHSRGGAEERAPPQMSRQYFRGGGDILTAGGASYSDPYKQAVGLGRRWGTNSEVLRLTLLWLLISAFTFSELSPLG